VRTEPLVLVDGTLERHAAAGGAINVLVRRLAALDAPDLLTERPAATVKDFSLLDERELERVFAEQRLVAVAGGTPAAAAPPTSGRTGALSAVASADGAQRAATSGTSAAPGRAAAAPADASPARTLTPAGSDVPEGSGAEDFRAVAPPVMSFAQGRRR